MNNDNFKHDSMSSVKISLNCYLVARQVLSITETYRTISWNLLVNVKVIAFRTESTMDHEARNNALDE